MSVERVSLTHVVAGFSAGVSEICLHSARYGRFFATLPGYLQRRELAAFLSPEVAVRSRAAGCASFGFAELR